MTCFVNNDFLQTINFETEHSKYMYLLQRNTQKDHEAFSGMDRIVHDIN